MTTHVLILCTHNSARSVLAEATLNHVGRGRFTAYSAGSSPRANQQPNPLALETLRKHGIATAGLYSKSWDAFGPSDSTSPTATARATAMDIIITVCDNAAGEVCPFWPGNPATAHWGYADPSAVTGTDDDRRRAFEQTWLLIHQQLLDMLTLPLESMAGPARVAALRSMAPTQSALT